MGHQTFILLKSYLGDSDVQPGFRSLIKNYPDLMPVLEQLGDTHGCKNQTRKYYEIVFKPYQVDRRKIRYRESENYNPKD